MSFTQEQVTAVEEAINNAIAGCNGGGEIFFDCPTNREILRKIMIENGTDRSLWINASMWVAGIIGGRADNRFKKRLTQAEQDRINNRMSPQQKFPDKHEPVRTFRDYMNDLQTKWQDRLNGKTPDAVVVVPQAELPPVTADYEKMTPENKKLYRALTAEQMRSWIRRRAQFVRNELYPAPTQGE